MFGVFDTSEAAGLTALGLHALQHRGQEACGIASFDGQRFHTERHMGEVTDHFADGALVAQHLPGESAIGHTRYSTAGGSVLLITLWLFLAVQTWRLILPILATLLFLVLLIGVASVSYYLIERPGQKLFGRLAQLRWRNSSVPVRSADIAR